jgi:hypothetical protein
MSYCFVVVIGCSPPTSISHLLSSISASGQAAALGLLSNFLAKPIFIFDADSMRPALERLLPGIFGPDPNTSEKVQG